MTFSNKISSKLLIAFAFALPVFAASAQSPVSGFMAGKGHGAAVVSYNAEKYSSVFLVPKEIDGVPVFNEVAVKSVSFFANYGISDKLDVSLNAPYTTATGKASDQILKNLKYQNERKGLQDLSVTLKYKPLSYTVGAGTLDFMGALGVQTPLGDYRADEGLQSIIAIGNRSTSVNAFAIAHYKFNTGFFATAQVGYSARSNGVPSALISEFKAGYALENIYIDVYSASQLSSGGTDILQDGFDGVFPKTKVNYTKIGANVFVPVAKGFGVSVGGSTYVAGRNIGKGTGVYGALVFSF